MGGARPALSVAAPPRRVRGSFVGGACAYRVEVIAPEQLRRCSPTTSTSRFQNAPDTEAIDAGELARCSPPPRTGAARTLLETEGYFRGAGAGHAAGPAATASRWCGCW